MEVMIVFAVCWAALGSGLGWLVMRGNPDRRAKIIGPLFVLLGLGGGWFIYSTDRQLRAETLYEVMAEGSIGATVGSPAPVRQLQFTVEHPGIEHTLMVSPSSYQAADPTGEAELSFQLKDPTGNAIIEEKRIYAVRSNGRNSADWEASYHTFVPSTRGTYTLEITLLTVEIPHLHVRVVDPDKTDGKRIPGF